MKGGMAGATAAMLILATLLDAALGFSNVGLLSSPSAVHTHKFSAGTGVFAGASWRGRGRVLGGISMQGNAKQLEFYQAKDIQVNWNSPAARGNFGCVYFGKVKGQECVVKCPILEEFSLKLFDTERAVNIKLNKASGTLSVPWAQMIGEVNIDEGARLPDNLARIGIVWRKEGDGQTLENYLQGNKDLAKALGVQQDRGLLRKELSLKVMAEMLAALQLMQEKGIMHRDIKPSNTLVVPSDSKHSLKIIDFGSSCDWADPFKLGLGDATNDPMYAAPEKTLNFVAPGKFDVFSVGMTGLRVLIPTFSRGGASRDWPGGRFQEFAESEFPGTGWDLEKYLEAKSKDTREKQLANECKELLENPEMEGVRKLLQSILVQNVIGRPGVQQALQQVGSSFAEAAKQDLANVKSAEDAVKRLVQETSKEGQQKEREEEAKVKREEQEEEKRQKFAADKAFSAAKAFLLEQTQQQGSARVREIFGSRVQGVGKRSGLGDNDIANVVPDSWQEGKEYFKSPRLGFSKGEIVVAFRSDGSRRFGKIIQDYGEQTYDILVDRSGGDGEGQFRTERAAAIGKIATGRSLQEEERASQETTVRALKKQRKDVVAKAQVGQKIPDDWLMNKDVAFSPTSFFKSNEFVVVANPDGSLCFGTVKKANGDGTLEVQVSGSKKKIFFAGSLGKILI